MRAVAAIPESPDAIDAQWLQDALRELHPGVRVSDFEILERHEVTNSHARLRIRYAEAAGAPEQLFLKLLPCDPARRGAIAMTQMGPREARFYAELAPSVGMRVPQAHAARYDAEAGSFMLLLEDLVTAGCGVSDGTVGVSADAAAAALRDLAELHVRFEDPARRKAEAGWVPEPRHSDYGTKLLQIGLDQHRDKISDAFAELSQLYIAHGPELHALWQAGPKTVIHGDTHIGNLFDDAGRTGFLDWGIINTSTPLRDLSYFLTMAMNPEERRAHERDLISHYLDVRAGLGADNVAPLSFDEAWRAHRLHAAYTVPASCQIVTFPPDATERRRVFAAAFLARAEAAIVDLDARGAVAEFGL